MFRERKAKTVREDTRSTLDRLHSTYVQTLSDVSQVLYYTENGKLLLDYYGGTIEDVSCGFWGNHRVSRVSKEKLVEEYERRLGVGGTPKPLDSPAVCPHCGSATPYEWVDGVGACTVCGTEQIVTTVSDVPAYNEQHHEKQNFSYRRLNHMIECLNQLQAKETSDIRPELLDAIREELRKQRITDPSSLTRTDIRAILKKLGHDGLYEHSYLILNKITGKPSPQLPAHTIELLNTLFNEAQSLWFITCPSDRINFLPYLYVLRKLFELLNLDEFMYLCPLLKTKDKILEYDKIWKQICAGLRWEYIPTL